MHARAASDRNACYPENAASDDFFFVAVWKVASDLPLRCILGFMHLLEVLSLPCPPGYRDAIAKGLKTGYMNSVYYRPSLSVRCALPCVDSPHLPYLHSTHPIEVPPKLAGSNVQPCDEGALFSPASAGQMLGIPQYGTKC